MRFVKKVSLFILVVGYAFAGINHFLNPESYIHIIPRYIPFPVLMNIIAGVAEISFALMLIRPKTRPWAIYGIILMLAAFLPVHIQMLIDAPFKLANITVTPLIAWVRLILQPALMLWVWWHRKN
ncbi:DoxX family protein [Mucilaginibacter ginsenosidivorax]|uniref:DoxX family protein n=1 Tax=Mucilaginibacter ginsenosidivorax TaxID=862126 RepID=A0A5B8VYY0_9SPHI|nr:MauE/DoxX family redox-associated membrane protein [Mucilaginibacter ginsenosidivorax]QEC75805.1 DoxX family protein [Mucilaginibacter ginsenosidivorax]